MKYLIVTFLMLCAPLVFAAGLPVIDGKITSEHTMITLTESQAEEIEVLGTLTLTNGQWSDLKKVRPACPKRFDVVLSNDPYECTGGYSEYVILVSKTKAAILNDSISKADNELRGVFTQSPTMVYSKWWVTYRKGLTIQVDTNGNFYLAGVHIPYNHLLELLALPKTSPHLTTNSRETVPDRSVYFASTPSSDLSKVFSAQQLTVINQAIKQGGWSTYGLPNPPTESSDSHLTN